MSVDYFTDSGEEYTFYSGYTDINDHYEYGKFSCIFNDSFIDLLDSSNYLIHSNTAVGDWQFTFWLETYEWKCADQTSGLQPQLDVRIDLDTGQGCIS